MTSGCWRVRPFGERQSRRRRQPGVGRRHQSAASMSVAPAWTSAGAGGRCIGRRHGGRRVRRVWRLLSGMASAVGAAFVARQKIQRAARQPRQPATKTPNQIRPARDGESETWSSSSHTRGPSIGAKNFTHMHCAYYTTAGHRLATHSILRDPVQNRPGARRTGDCATGILTFTCTARHILKVVVATCRNRCAHASLRAHTRHRFRQRRHQNRPHITGQRRGPSRQRDLRQTSSHRTSVQTDKE